MKHLTVYSRLYEDKSVQKRQLRNHTVMTNETANKLDKLNFIVICFFIFLYCIGKFTQICIIVMKIYNIIN